MWIIDSYFKAAWNSGAARDGLKDQCCLSSIVLHASERSSCPLGDDSSSGKPIQGRRVQQFTHCNFPVHHIDADSNHCHYTQSIHFRQSGEYKYFDTED